MIGSHHVDEWMTRLFAGGTLGHCKGDTCRSVAGGRTKASGVVWEDLCAFDGARSGIDVRGGDQGLSVAIRLQMFLQLFNEVVSCVGSLDARFAGSSAESAGSLRSQVMRQIKDVGTRICPGDAVSK